MAEFLEVLGKPIPRVDAQDKLNGKALYAGDLSLPDMLYLKVLRSNRPHAKILKIHTKSAETYPGVAAVFTHRDIPGVNRVGPRNKDQPVLCDDRVRYVGDPVAVIAAETLDVAEHAINLIEVEYEDLPGIFSSEEALASKAIKIHEHGNLFFERTLLKGDPDQALIDADVVITNTYKTQMVEHAYLEPEAGVAKYEGGKVTVMMPSKYAHFEQGEISAVLGLPSEKVRVVLTTIGGSFGDKTGLGPGYYAALVSFKTGRPSKMVYPREESFAVSAKRHPYLIHYTTGAKKDGKIVAVKVEILADTGAYSSFGASVLTRSMVHASGPYEIPNISINVKGFYTNNPIGGAMRGFGVAQVVVAHESQMDILAEVLKMDASDIRSINGLKAGSLTATNQRLGTSVGLEETIKKVKEEITKRGVPISFGSKRYAWGIASMYYGIGITGLPNPAISRVEVNETGDFSLYMGCGDVGQGSATVMAQIASEVLGVGVEKIKLVVGDTDLCPDSGTSSASRITYTVGRSVQIASEKLRTLLQEEAGKMIGVPKEDLILKLGFLYSPEAPNRKISVREVVKKLNEEGIFLFGEGKFNPETTGLNSHTGQGLPYPTYAFASQGALVSVDLDSGEVEVLDVVACHDVGMPINPMNIVGQIEGGVSMGFGYGLMEEVLLEKGAIQNPRFSEYFIPSVMDVPHVTSLLVEAKEPTGPFGAKGVGEPALLPTAAAILNAIAVASGVRAKEIPVTSEKLWELIKKR